MMVIPVTFLNKRGEEIPAFSFPMEHDAASLVVSCLGYDLVDMEETPLPLPQLLEDIRLYQTSEIASIVDQGRTALVQHGGHIEGVTLPAGIPFKFPEVDEGFISEWIETLRQFALDAIEKHEGLSLMFNPT